MAKLLFSLTVCFLILFSAQAVQQSQRQSQKQSQCRIQNIDALEPRQRVQSEAGVTELFDENEEQLECAGVAVIRHTIQPRGLLLPHFHNAQKLTYIIQGRGMHGAAIPGCPETYQSPQQSQEQRYQQGQSEEYEQGEQQPRSRHRDQHQKIRFVRQGDMVATPIGVANWFYNDGQTPLVLVSFLDTSNNENQLDNNRRSFYLAGNPQEATRQGGSSSYQGTTTRGTKQQRSTVNNILSGFDDELMAEVFGVRQETVRRLRGENDNRGNIIRVENGLQVVRPPRMEQEQEEREQYQGRYNGVEESLCNIKLRVNMDSPSRADVFNPEAGRINRINSRNLPVLRYFQLNAERGVLQRNALMTPHWNMNAHSVIYVTRGTAQVQIVGNYQQPIFNGELRQGQLLVVPQNFAVVKRAGDRGFEWVSIKTNDNAMISPIAGMNSAFRAMPQEILMNAFRISSEEATRLKYNRQEVELFTPRFPSQQIASA